MFQTVHELRGKTCKAFLEESTFCWKRAKQIQFNKRTVGNDLNKEETGASKIFKNTFLNHFTYK